MKMGDGEAPKVVFVHTVSGVLGMFGKLCEEYLRGVKLCHVADDGLIQMLREAGGLTPAVYRRVSEHVVAAEEQGAAVVQLTCSSISPCADVVQRMVSIPVLKIDRPMAEDAVSRYTRIGIAATSPTTLSVSTELVAETAREQGRRVTITSVMCEGAYDAFFEGEMEEHDRIVREHLGALAGRTDVILLAQASMARVADTLEEGLKRVPILSSPRPAMERLAEVIRDLAGARGRRK